MSHQLSNLSAPLRLILQLLQVMPNATTHQEVQQLVTPDMDWDLFFDLAIDHRVVPMIHRRIQHHYADIFPEDIQEDLEDEVFDNGARNVALSRTLLAAIDLLRDHGIPALAFKGPTLATMVYGDLSGRMFSDLDILVPEEHFLKAKQILLEDGYESDIRSLFLITSDQQEQTLLCELGECPLYKAKRSIQIDLHQRLVAGDFVQMANPLDSHIWQNPHTTHLLGQPVQTLGVEDLVLYLCIHGAKDLWKRLGWLCDLATLIQSSSQPASPIKIQWDIVLENAKLHHLESIVGVSLALTETILGLPFPSEAQTLQKRANYSELTQRSLTRISQALLQEEPSFHLVERFRFRFQSLEHPQDRWLCAIAFYKSLITPTYADTLFLGLPPALYGLYRFIRPFRLIKEWLVPANFPA